jgi:hypothetical protein
MGIQKFDAASYLFLKMLISQLIFEADKHFYNSHGEIQNLRILILILLARPKKSKELNINLMWPNNEFISSSCMF